MKNNPMSTLGAILVAMTGFLASDARGGGAMNLDQTISDQAQSTTLAFSGLAMMTGNLNAQSFYPPGKVADYTGFQYLRDNDPDNMGHNTSFLTRVAENVIYILTDAQLAKLAALAVAQEEQYNLYAYKRFPLMKAFRRLIDGDIPSGTTGLDLTAVKKASRELYLIDGQISFDRALLYAGILNSLDTTQKAYLAAMKGKGWASWPDTSSIAYQAVIKAKTQSLPQGSAVLVMTYAGDLFSWYAGSVEADVYFCPERQGTYFGSFYMKDAPAIGHEGYSISEELTATAGGALCDSAKGYVTADQAAQFSGLVETQRNNLYANKARSVVQCRSAIAALLRGLLTSTADSDAVKAKTLELSGVYGDLDGENNYNYATVIAKVYKSLSAAQKVKLAALRKSIMSGVYADGTPFDYTICSTPYLYSETIKDTSVLAPYIANTDYLFGVSSSAFTLTSSVGAEGGALPIDYTADGSGASPDLSWSNAPAGAAEFAMLMTTLPGDGTTKWNWVLYRIPATASGLAKNNTTVGTAGMNSDTGKTAYAPPQSQGPGTKVYTFTIYALSASPALPATAAEVTGDTLAKAIAPLTLGSASLNLSYARQAPVANFTYARNGRTVTFANASGLSATAWAWEFGDSATSAETNPTHTYQANGSYTVKLTVKNEFGSASARETVTVSGAATTYALKVVNGTGSGVYAAGTSVTIQATPPTAGRKFEKWTATAGTLASATASKTTFVMPASPATVTANYSASYTLTYKAGPGGSIRGAATQTVAYGGSGSPVTAVPLTGYRFSKWSDGLTANPRTDTKVTAAKSVTATFTIGKYALIVNGAVSGEYQAGETARVSAKPVETAVWRFTGWTGEIDGLVNRAGAETTLIMPPADVAVTANFSRLDWQPSVTFIASRLAREKGSKNTYRATACFIVPKETAITPPSLLSEDSWISIEIGKFSFGDWMSNATSKRIAANRGSAIFKTDANDTIVLKWDAKKIALSLKSESPVNATANILDIPVCDAGDVSGALEDCSLSFGDMTWVGAIPWTGTVKRAKNGAFWAVIGKNAP